MNLAQMVRLALALIMEQKGFLAMTKKAFVFILSAEFCESPCLYHFSIGINLIADYHSGWLGARSGSRNSILSMYKLEKCQELGKPKQYDYLLKNKQ